MIISAAATRFSLACVTVSDLSFYLILTSLVLDSLVAEGFYISVRIIDIVFAWPAVDPRGNVAIR